MTLAKSYYGGLNFVSSIQARLNVNSTTAVDRPKGCLIVSLKVCDVQVAVPVAECLPSDESDATRHCLHSG